MITLLTVSFLVFITLGSVYYIYSRRTYKKGSADTWEKLMMSRLDK